jgi:hypothetical protein
MGKPAVKWETMLGATYVAGDPDVRFSAELECNPHSRYWRKWEIDVWRWERINGIWRKAYRHTSGILCFTPETALRKAAQALVSAYHVHLRLIARPEEI